MRIEKLKWNFNVDVKLVHFTPHPIMPPEGRSMAEYFAARGWTERLSRPQSDRTVLRLGRPIERTLPDYRERDDRMEKRR